MFAVSSAHNVKFKFIEQLKETNEEKIQTFFFVHSILESANKSTNSSTLIFVYCWGKVTAKKEHQTEKTSYRLEGSKKLLFT